MHPGSIRWYLQLRVETNQAYAVNVIDYLFVVTGQYMCLEGQFITLHKNSERIVHELVRHLQNLSSGVSVKCAYDPTCVSDYHQPAFKRYTLIMRLLLNTLRKLVMCELCSASNLSDNQLVKLDT